MPIAAPSRGPIEAGTDRRRPGQRCAARRRAADRLRDGSGIGSPLGPARPSRTEDEATTADSDKRILVTGARGFLGRPTVRALTGRGWQVHAVTSRARPAGGGGEAAGGLTWHRADLLDPAATAALVEAARPAALLHLAWHMGPDAYVSSENFRWVGAGIDLLRRFTAAGGRRAVLAGTGAEYEWTEAPCDEESTPLRPRSLYGASKVALYHLATAWAASSAAAVAWPRIFWVYGPGERSGRLLPSVLRSLDAGRRARCTHGRQVRDFLYVDDVADALARLVESDLAGAVNLASGVGVEVRELALGAARRLGAEDRVELGAIPLPDDDPPRVVASVARLRDELGWQPRVGLDEGLDRTVAAWRPRAAEEPA